MTGMAGSGAASLAERAAADGTTFVLMTFALMTFVDLDGKAVAMAGVPLAGTAWIPAR
ncbi:hypothetical protein [Frankia tisae]|uniref:hypothetical protein n=1 Tax=Frankia tisae TaxID=2950104 RepID=UPI0021BEB7AE|nr:hypothetical protein [Frankia tisae]